MRFPSSFRTRGRLPGTVNNESEWELDTCVTVRGGRIPADLVRGGSCIVYLESDGTEVGMATHVVDGIEGLEALSGEHLGHSPWLEISQERVNRFADATLDHQWIHLDVDRAVAESPFGGTIAHGYLTVSLLPHLLGEIVQVENVAMAINYGLNRLRFPAPVPVGRRIRLGVTMASVDEIPGGVQCQLDCVVEVEDSAKPGLAAEVLFRYYA